MITPQTFRRCSKMPEVPPAPSWPSHMPFQPVWHLAVKDVLGSGVPSHPVYKISHLYGMSSLAFGGSREHRFLLTHSQPRHADYKVIKAGHREPMQRPFLHHTSWRMVQTLTASVIVLHAWHAHVARQPQRQVHASSSVEGTCLASIMLPLVKIVT